MLEIADLAVAYGGLRALRGVSLSVAEGQFVAVVGPNGAGKTTLFKAVCGVVPIAAGRIAFAGATCGACPPPSARISASRMFPRGGRSSRR